MKCPICKETVTASHFACHSGAKGGAATTEAKAAASRANGAKGGAPKGTKRDPEQMRKAALARWAKHRKEKD